MIRLVALPQRPMTWYGHDEADKYTLQLDTEFKELEIRIHKQDVLNIK